MKAVLPISLPLAISRVVQKEIMGSKIIMYPLKKILFKIPEKIIDLLKIENLLFRYLKSKRYLKNGRSYVMICKKIHQGITNV